MADFPAMPLFCEPLLADTDHLTDAEFGLYMRMLTKLWLAPNNRFPNDDAWLGRKFRKSPEEVSSQLRPLLVEFFRTDGNWLHHKRIDKEFAYVERKSKKQSDRAKSRWDKEKAECRGNAAPALQGGISPACAGGDDENNDIGNSLKSPEKPECRGNAPTPTPTHKDKGDSPLKPPRKPREPPASRLPADWQPAPDLIDFALNEGLTHDDVRRELGKFRDHWASAVGARARKSDWSACWRNWVRKAAEDRARPAGRGPGGGGTGGGDRRAGDRQAGRLADTLAVLHRRGSLAGPHFDEARMGRFPH